MSLPLPEPDGAIGEARVREVGRAEERSGEEKRRWRSELNLLPC